MPRFVILRHEFPPGHDRGSHFDLMLELGETLRTWAFPELPSLGKIFEAEALPDHRLAYLDYEGPVSGNRGAVNRVERGEYETLAESEGLLQVRLVSGLLRGILELRQARGAANWTVFFRAG